LLPLIISDDLMEMVFARTVVIVVTVGPDTRPLPDGRGSFMQLLIPGRSGASVTINGIVSAARCRQVACPAQAATQANIGASHGSDMLAALSWQIQRCNVSISRHINGGTHVTLQGVHCCVPWASPQEVVLYSLFTCMLTQKNIDCLPYS
jgi:hypothetical protein